MQTLRPHSSKFPKAYAFLAEDLPRIPEGDLKTWDAFLKHAHLSSAEARAAVSPNSGAPVLFAKDLGSALWGQFDPEVPNRIEIGMLVLEKFETDSFNPTARTFLRTKVLHEMCHWGCHRGNFPDPDTAGENFEKELFNQELRAWFLPSLMAQARSGMLDTAVFNDPVARAQALMTQAEKSEYVPGRTDDPDHRVFGGIDVAEGMPRGFRNNNPGNIRVGDPWKGLAPFEDQEKFQQIEKSFGVFREPEWGLRAIARLLRRYKGKGFDTPRKIIERWAPASDRNNVESYSGHFADALGVRRDDVVNADDDDQIIKMMMVIATHENGSRPPYALVQFRAALKLL